MAINLERLALKLMNTDYEIPNLNKLLCALPSADYHHIHQHLEVVILSFGEVLYETGDVIKYVYFPNDALVSLLTNVDQHRALEVGLVGREGMVGVALALGANVSLVRAIVQGTGTAMRIKASFFRQELGNSILLQRGVNLYINALMAQIAQTAACNRFHHIEARLARWLLMTRDRVYSDHFYLTHEFLAHMLGVRRVGVTKAAHSLKKQKLIEYSRGNITILNLAGLEHVSCSCYEMIKVSDKY